MRLNRKTNSAIVGYFAVSSGIGTLAGVVALIVWIYKIAVNKSTFTWSALAAILIITLLMGGLSYILFRIYSEEEER